MSPSTLRARCQTCLRAIDHANGALWIDHRDLDRLRIRRSEWNAETGQPVLFEDTVAEAVAALPVSWHVTCRECVPAGLQLYQVPFPRDHARLLGCTADLLPKRWLADTDISQLLREAATRTRRFTPPRRSWDVASIGPIGDPASARPDKPQYRPNDTGSCAEDAQQWRNGQVARLGDLDNGELYAPVVTDATQARHWTAACDLTRATTNDAAPTGPVLDDDSLVRVGRLWPRGQAGDRSWVIRVRFSAPASEVWRHRMAGRRVAEFADLRVALAWATAQIRRGSRDPGMHAHAVLVPGAYAVPSSRQSNRVVWQAFTAGDQLRKEITRSSRGRRRMDAHRTITLWLGDSTGS